MPGCTGGAAEAQSCASAIPSNPLPESLAGRSSATIHLATRHSPTSCRLRRLGCLAAGPAPAGGQPAGCHTWRCRRHSWQDPRHCMRAARRLQPPGGRNRLVRPVTGHRPAARLGNPPLRSPLAPSGPGVRAAGRPVPPAAGPARRAAGGGQHRGASPAAAGLAGLAHLLLHAGAAGRRAGAQVATDTGRLRPRRPGAAARRILGARQPDRPVPDGLGPALPAGPVRRPARQHPHLRSRQPAQPVSGPGGAIAAGAGVSARRGRPCRLPRALARALRRRSVPGRALPRHRQRRGQQRHRILPAAVLRADGDPVRLPAGRQRADPAWTGRAAVARLSRRCPAALRLHRPGCRAPGTASRRDLS